ncbi:hypothetical protein E3O62_06750 [Cryobacterium sp. TMT2-15-1]|uniref:type IV pilus modification PilV family protein n=1 Tax=Cryobacterium sp. TMT2-15-1 TaxID=1259246 RepID=UPI001069D59D|nr:type II secretion system GspH family protein [Cryobacterium sp. TMT2-15-1]TFC60397.1 hypothetical protein E3O62_06750 [Cryobacterium sp. TMT2-15-1]
MNTQVSGRRSISDDVSGFGIIEIVVSMFLLALLIISFAPVLVNTIKFTARNTTIATAAQMANKQIEAARAVRSATSTPPSCNDIKQFLLVTLPPVVDPRGITLQPQWDPFATCTASTIPGYVRVRVSVSQAGYATSTASAATFIFVAAGGN